MSDKKYVFFFGEGDTKDKALLGSRLGIAGAIIGLVGITGVTLTLVF